MGGIAGAIGGIVGGAMQGNAASDAADAQIAAARENIAFQKETRDLIRADLEPWKAGGNLANQALMYELGLGPKPMIGGTAPTIETITTGGGYGSGFVRNADGSISGRQPQIQGPTTTDAFGNPISIYSADGSTNGRFGSDLSGDRRGQATTQYKVGDNVFNTMEEAQAWANANKTGATEYGGYTATDAHKYQLEQGLDAVNANAGARGGLMSGRTLEALQKTGQGIASSFYDNFLNRLTGVSGTGMSAAGMQGNASSNAAGAVGNALGDIGNAQAAGAIGQANAWTGALGNVLGSFSYQNGINGNSSGGSNNWWGSWA